MSALLFSSSSFCFQGLFLVVIATTAATQEFNLKLEESLAAVEAAGSIITSSIPDWYSYDYVQNGTSDVIKDSNLFSSLGGNNITLTQGGTQQPVAYNKIDVGAYLSFGSLSIDPFIFLVEINNISMDSIPGESPIPGEFNVRSFLPTNSEAIAEVEGNVASNNYSLNYWAYQGASSSRASVAQVYFAISNVAEWGSLNLENIEITNNSTNEELDVTFAYAPDDVIDLPDKIVVGYTLFSRGNGSVFDRSSLNPPLKILLQVVTGTFDACEMNPCLNGNCSGDGLNYTCICDDGWEGNHCDVDVDECKSNPCVNGNCTNGNNSYFCSCDSGWGGITCSVFLLNYTMLCDSTEMTFHVQNQYYIEKGIKLQDLHLNDFSCKGENSSVFANSWTFTVSPLSSCGNVLTSNSTHLIYSNTLTNSLPRDDIYIGRTGFFFAFSCAYKRKINLISLFATNFDGLNHIINVTSVAGIGLFHVTMNHYANDMFNKPANRFEYTSDDRIYVKLELDAVEPTLNLVIERCWVTPSSNLTDPKLFNFILDGCSYDSNSVSILRSGNGTEAMFSSPLFAYRNYNITYMHCSIVICSSAGNQSCEPLCNERTKRSTPHEENGLVRSKRDVDLYYIREVLSIGPFFRRGKEAKPTVPVNEEKPVPHDSLVRVIMVGMATTIVASALCCFIFCYFLRRKYDRKYNRGGSEEIAIEYYKTFNNANFVK